MDSIISSFHESLINSFSNIYLVILLNLFFIFATYTDLKYMKIYDKFNIVMLITRILILIYYGLTADWIMGGQLFLTFLLSAMYTKIVLQEILNLEEILDFGLILSFHNTCITDYHF